MSMQTPGQIAAEIATDLGNSRSISNGSQSFSGLTRNTREIIAVAAWIAATRAIEADRAQRPAAERWEIVDDLYPQNVATFTCDREAAEEIARSWGEAGGTIATFTARPAGSL